jgi:hypothetical protein
MVADQVDSGWRDDRNELLDKLQRAQKQMGCSVTVSILELIENISVLGEREPVGCQRGAEDISEKLFQKTSLPLFDVCSGMDGESVESAAKFTLELWSVSTIK